MLSLFRKVIFIYIIFSWNTYTSKLSSFSILLCTSLNVFLSKNDEIRKICEENLVRRSLDPGVRNAAPSVRSPLYIITLLISEEGESRAGRSHHQQHVEIFIKMASPGPGCSKTARHRITLHSNT